MTASANPVLEVKDLVVGFATDDGYIQVLDHVGFKVEPGQTLGIVGESGCGKSVTSLAVMRLLPQPHSHIESGNVLFDGKNLLSETAEAMQDIRGRRISMIFQEPMTALNPVHRVGQQLAEVFRLHFHDMQSAEIEKAVLDILKQVGIPEPEKRMQEYPHQLSGGMRQRVMIAMALACKPDVLIADEPTTALDVTIQAQILALMKQLQADLGMAIVFITHDLGVVAQMCDEVAVMYAGHVVEQAPVAELFAKPRHPYTLGLLNSIPRLSDIPKTELSVIDGTVPSLRDIPSGCRFHDRCIYAKDECKHTKPILQDVTGEHSVACIRWEELPT